MLIISGRVTARSQYIAQILSENLTIRYRPCLLNRRFSDRFLVAVPTKMVSKDPTGKRHLETFISPQQTGSLLPEFTTERPVAP